MDRQTEKICFIGDSITHGFFYTGYIYEYYLTRFPMRNISIYNCGIAGDTAAGAVRRLEGDVLPLKPDKAVVMFGMNDINRSLYVEASPSEEVLKERSRALFSFEENIRVLVGRLSAAGADVILCTPTPYDQYTNIKSQSRNGCDVLYGLNEGLAELSERIKAIASEYRLELVDFHGPMTDIIKCRQAIVNALPIISEDRIHPAEAGVLLMAYLFLKQQGSSSVVSEARLDVYALRLSGQENFVYKPQALPLRVDDIYRFVDRIVPLTNDLNRELLYISGLENGRYILCLDGADILQATDLQLKEGINLALEDRNPLRGMTDRIHEMNLKRFELEQKLRTIRFIEHFPALAGIAADDKTAFGAFYSDWLEKVENEAELQYWREQLKTYGELLPIREELTAMLEESMEILHEFSSRERKDIVVGVRKQE